MWLKVKSSLLGREGERDRLVRLKRGSWKVAPGWRRGRADFHLPALAHKDRITATEVEEEYCLSN